MDYVRAHFVEQIVAYLDMIIRAVPAKKSKITLAAFVYGNERYSRVALFVRLYHTF